MRVFRKLNNAWLRIEQMCVVIGLVTMAFVVTGDVLHRKVANLTWQTPGARVGTLLVIYGLAVAALRTRMNDGPSTGKALQPGWLRPLMLAALVTAALAGLAHALVVLFPAGLIFSQRLALVLMLWVAFFGASIATHEGKHLRIDAVLRLCPPRTQRHVITFARSAAALACALLALLSGRYCTFLYGEYADTGGVAGVFDELPIPQFLAYAVLPLSLTVMALRFLGHAIGSWRATEPVPDRTPGGDA